MQHRPIGLRHRLTHHRKTPPLMAIDRAEVTVLIGPFVPDANAIFLEVADVRVAREEPQKFMHDGFQMQLLRRHQRETIGHPVALLHPEMRDRPRSRAVGRGHPLLQHFAQRIMVLFHAAPSRYPWHLSLHTLPRRAPQGGLCGGNRLTMPLPPLTPVVSRLNSLSKRGGHILPLPVL